MQVRRGARGFACSAEDRRALRAFKSANMRAKHVRRQRVLESTLGRIRAALSREIGEAHGIDQPALQREQLGKCARAILVPAREAARFVGVCQRDTSLVKELCEFGFALRALEELAEKALVK